MHDIIYLVWKDVFDTSERELMKYRVIFEESEWLVG
jgi:hypothetical protein